jgi:hypothetical protein
MVESNQSEGTEELTSAPLGDRGVWETNHVTEPTKLQEHKYKNNHQSDQIPVLKIP